MVDESFYRPALRMMAGSMLLVAILTACSESYVEDPREQLNFTRTGTLQSPKLDEVSGIIVSERLPGVMWVHNDDGAARLHAVDANGAARGYLDLDPANNRDWEDFALVPGEQHDWLVAADVGDNMARRASVMLYVVAEPVPSPGGRVSARIPPHNVLRVDWPDGPRDCESVAWDPVGDQLLLLSKRDDPPRLYAIDRESLFKRDQVTPEFLGEVTSLRPPTHEDQMVFGKRTPWVSQPTGMDLSRDGRRIAVITYRSLYLWERNEGANWLDTLNQPPLEILGPPGDTDESVGFSPDGRSMWMIGEGEGAGIYRFDLKD